MVWCGDAEGLTDHRRLSRRGYPGWFEGLMVRLACAGEEGDGDADGDNGVIGLAR